MEVGWITATGIGALAGAGRRGVWPHLKVFKASHDAELNHADRMQCIQLLHEVWPELTVKFGCLSVSADATQPELAVRLH